MRTGGRTTAALLAILTLTIAACTSQAAEPPARADTATTSSTSTSSTEPPPTTEPPRAFEPLLADPDLPLADQVEAAYLFHWEVLLHAYRTGDTSQLPLVYSGEALEARTAEIQSNSANGLRVEGRVDHNYVIHLVDDTKAAVMDGYRNHLVAVDSDTGEALGESSGRQLLQEFQMESVQGRWMVVLTLRHEVGE